MNDLSAKSTKATPLDIDVCWFANVPPFAAYCPEALTSPVAVYAVVAADKVAVDLYKANLIK